MMSIRVEDSGRSSAVLEIASLRRSTSMKSATVLFGLCLLEVCLVPWPFRCVLAQESKPESPTDHRSQPGRR